MCFLHNTSVNVVTGMVSATAATLPTYPLDVVRAHLSASNVSTAQTGAPQTLRSVAAGIVARDGVRGLYRGLTPTLCTVAPFVGLQLCG